VGGLQVGGNANNGSNDGLAYLNANNAPSNANANIGSRLNWYITHITMCKHYGTLPLGKRYR